MSYDSGINQAIYAVGSQIKLAHLLGCTQQHISVWKRQGYVTIDRVVEVEQVTGIPRALLINPKLISLLTPADFK